MRSFLITIDTEGDDLWSRPRYVTTENARFLPRFQNLCERYGLKPTYLTNYEMAKSRIFQEFGAEMLRRGAGEVGMHLHAWDSPPLRPLTPDDSSHHPYLYEYAEPVMREKVALMTHLLEEVFGQKMLSHRAGRWGFDETYARILVEFGYRVDCSVTPLISWRSSLGDPSRLGGPDYARFPATAYFVDVQNVGIAGDSPLLEVPLTVMGPRSAVGRRLHPWLRRGPRLVRGLLSSVDPPTTKLVPNGHNLASLLRILHRAVVENLDYVEFALHSSELMPGGSPRFRTQREIETLYAHLETLFATASKWFKGATLQEYRARFMNQAEIGPVDSPPSTIGALV